MDVAGFVKVKVQADLSDLDQGFAEAKQKSAQFDRDTSGAFKGLKIGAADARVTLDGLARSAAVANDNLKVTGSTARFVAIGMREMISAGTALGAATVAAFAVGPIFDYRDAVAEVSTLVDTATFDMNRLERSALQMAKTFGGGVIPQVKAFNDVISSGTEDLMKATQVVEGANKLAIGGATQVATATGALTSILNAYGDKAGTVAEISDAMFIAMRDGKTTIDQLANSIGRVAPIAATVGVSLDELLSAIAALTLGGISTAESVTGIRAILSAVAKPSQEATELAAKLGLQFNTAAIQGKGFQGFLEDLMKTTGGNTDQLAVLMGGVEALVPILALAGEAGDSFNNTLDNMGKKAGATQEAVDKMMNTPGFQAGRIWSALQAEIFGVGGALDMLTPLLKAIADNMDLIVAAAVIFTAGHLASAIAAVVIQFAALTAGMGAAAIAARALSIAMAFVGGPIGLAVAALAAAYLLLRDNVTATEQAVMDSEAAYDQNKRAMDAAKDSSVGYTKALRDQIAMQVQVARTASIQANADFEAALERRNSFRDFMEGVTGYRLSFLPFDTAVEEADKAAGRADVAWMKLEDQLKEVDAGLAGVAAGTKDAAAGTDVATKATEAYTEILADARKQIGQLEIELATMGQAGAGVEALRFEFETLSKVMEKNGKITPDQRKEIHALAEEYGRLSEAVSRAKLQQDLLFDAQQAGRSEMEREVAETLRQYNLPVDLASADAAAIRHSLQIKKIADAWEDVRDVGRSAIQDITKSAMGGFKDWEDVVSKIATNILDNFNKLAFANPLQNAIYGDNQPTLDTVGGIGGFFKALLGGPSPAAGEQNVGTMSVNAGMVTINGAGVSGGGGLLDRLLNAANDNAPTSAGAPVIPVERAPLGPVGAAAAASAAQSGSGGLFTAGNYRAGVDARLTDILNTAAQRMGQKVHAYSGLRPGDDGQHGLGNATDIRLFDAAGKPLPNYQNASTFRQYELFAQQAKQVQMEKYPELNNEFRWGGYFGGPKGKYGAMDQMHFDLGGRAMAGGSFQNGLTAEQRALFPGVESVGMGKFQQTVVEATTNVDKMSTNAIEAAQNVGVLGKGAGDVGNALTSAAQSATSGGGGGGGGLFGWLGSLFGGGGATPFVETGGGFASVIGYASGTDFHPGGPARINEEGGEIVDLPRGTRVFPHDVSMAMANRGSSAPIFNLKREINVTPPSGYEANIEEQDDKRGNEKVNVTFSRMAANEAAKPGSPFNKQLRRGTRNIGPKR